MALTYKITKPSTLRTVVALPASKSISNRALILNALAGGKVQENHLTNISNCDDTKVMQNALTFNSHDINIGAAGTSMRFLTAFFAITPGVWNITGSERMKQRPIKILAEALKKLGAKIDYTENAGYPPLRIEGQTLTGGDAELDGSVSSQYISALLMIAPKLKEGLRLTLTGEVISEPYIKMTLGLLRSFGIESNIYNNMIEIKPQSFNKIIYNVESDWSSASYWYECMALAKSGNIKLKGLKSTSLQGDSMIAKYFEKYGVKTEFISDGIILNYKKELEDKDEEIEIDFVEQPDMAQTFVATSCGKNRKFHFKGLRTLKIKETDRIAALINEMRKLGYVLTEPAEGELAWDGTLCEKEENAVIDTYEDHRMAMSFAPLAYVMKGISIRNPHVVSKSYPTFWSDLKKAGFKMEETEQ